MGSEAQHKRLSGSGYSLNAYYGRRGPFTDEQADAILNNTRYIISCGVKITDIELKTGVSYKTLERIVYLPGHGCYRRTLEALEGLQVTDFYTPVGAARRLQALLAMGWGVDFLAERVRITRTEVISIAESKGDIPATVVYERIAEVFARLWCVDPGGVFPRSEVDYSAFLARKRGYRPALVWELENIDDPQLVPETEATPPSTHSVRQNIIDDLYEMSSAGVGLREAARRLGYTEPRSLEQRLRRWSEFDLLNRLRRHDRLSMAA